MFDDMLIKNDQLNTRIDLIHPIVLEVVVKYITEINPECLNEVSITPESNYNLRNRCRFLQPKLNTNEYQYNSFRYPVSTVEFFTIQFEN